MSFESLTSKRAMDPDTLSRVLPKLLFDGSNFAQFHRDFPSVAEYYGFGDLLSLKPGTTLKDEDARRERVARGIFRNHVSKSIDRQITMSADDDLMTLLGTMYEMFLNLDIDARAAAQVQLFSTMMRAGEKVSSFVGRMNELFQLMIRAEFPMDHNLQVATFMAKLLPQWRQLARDIANRDGDITYRQLATKLIVKERADTDNDYKATTEPVLQVSATAYHNQGSRGRSGRRGGRGRGRSQRSGARGSFQSSSRPPAQYTCHRCGQKGHYIKDCSNKPKNTAHLTISEQKPGTAEWDGICTVGHALSAVSNFLVPSNTFVLDSACTRTVVCPDVYLEDEQPHTEILGVANQSSTLVTLAKGNLRVGNLYLQGVLKCSSLVANLISEASLDLAGCKIISENGCKTVTKGDQTILVAQLNGGLYLWSPPGNLPILQDSAMLVGAKPSSHKQLWHLRMGHLNYDDLARLKHLATGVSYNGREERHFCVPCCRAKLHNIPFSGPKTFTPDSPMQLISVDLWGPFPVSSLYGESYAMLIVDGFSGFIWINLLSAKSQATPKLMSFLNHHDRLQSSLGKVAYLKTDGGGEFVNSELHDFLSSGIYLNFN